jgi:hypothetical protein
VAIVRLNTSDIEWIKRHASEDDAIPYGSDARGTLYFQVEITVPSVEHTTFAKVDMIRFDLGTDLPSDALNRWIMVPAARYLVSDES